MANGEERTPVLKNEDWWSCFIGWFFILLAVLALLPHTPKIGTWTELSQIFPKGWGTVPTTAVFFLITLVTTYVAGIYLKFDLKKYIPGFALIFVLSFISMVIAKQAFMHEWGISYVLFALVFGLLISNLFSVPATLKAAGQTEFFVKIGLVCMGSTIMFSTVLEAGLIGVIQALLVATTVWFMTYYICRAFKVSERFSAIIASANAICGVSATIAAGGAIQGNPKEISYMIAWVLVCAVVLILIMPPMAVWMGLPNNMAGAWLGGVIDNTGAVIAAGEVVGGKAAVDAAAMVKMAQNVLIGFAAFAMALWAAMKLDRAEGSETPNLMEVWYRFPKFVVGFVVASLVASFLIEPIYGKEFTKAATKSVNSYRSWFFTFCFVSIGLETDFKELVSVGGGRPAIAYWISQALNAVWTLFIVWILWSGTFFVPPILPD